MEADRLAQLKEVRDIQAYSGNWNCDPYMHGLYNGLEMAVATLEGREPKFKKAPKVWLIDKRLPKSLTTREDK